MKPVMGRVWMPQGYFRDSVYFSILTSEWPGLRAALEKRVAAYLPPPAALY